MYGGSYSCLQWRSSVLLNPSGSSLRTSAIFCTAETLIKEFFKPNSQDNHFQTCCWLALLLVFFFWSINGLDICCASEQRSSGHWPRRADPAAVAAVGVPQARYNAAHSGPPADSTSGCSLGAFPLGEERRQALSAGDTAPVDLSCSLSPPPPSSLVRPMVPHAR